MNTDFTYNALEQIREIPCNPVFGETQITAQNKSRSKRYFFTFTKRLFVFHFSQLPDHLVPKDCDRDHNRGEREREAPHSSTIQRGHTMTARQEHV